MAISDSFGGGTLAFSGDGANDTLEITSLDNSGTTLQYDLGAGPVTRTGVMTVSFDGQSGENTLVLHGSPDADNMNARDTRISYGFMTLSTANVHNLEMNGAGGQDFLSATGLSDPDDFFSGDVALLGGDGVDTIRIGQIDPRNLVVTEDDGGIIELSTNLISAENQTYNGPVRLTQSIVLNALNELTFSSTLDGGGVLMLRVTGTTTFGGPVGSLEPLADLFSGTRGRTVFNGALVRTLGRQRYDAPVSLGADTLFVGDELFAATIDGPFSLTADVTRTTTLGGAIGADTPLTFLDLTTGGPLTVNHDITTIDSIVLAVREGSVDSTVDKLVVNGSGGSTTLSAAEVVLRAGDDVELAPHTAIVASGSITFEGDVGDNDQFGSVITIGGAVSALSATVLGGDDPDQLTISEVAADQFNLAGISPDSHTNVAFTASGLSPANVGLHFEGAGGADSLVINLSLPHDVAYFSDQGPSQPNTGVVKCRRCLYAVV